VKQEAEEKHCAKQSGVQLAAEAHVVQCGFGLLHGCTYVSNMLKRTFVAS
jgi:hypothetical protein